MNKQTNLPLKAIFIACAILFALFLVLPMGLILGKSLLLEGNLSLDFYKQIFVKARVGQSFLGSVKLSAATGVITTALAFFLAYTIHYTNVSKPAKRWIETLASFPMLLPTITYGFAIIYSFGKQGLLTKLMGTQLFSIYGVCGLMIGYVIYTLPISFLLINNTMGYIDKKFGVVSRVMGDSPSRNFATTVLYPLLSTFAASFIQSFTLCFTDYGIPAALGGNVDLIATTLYNEMLGSLPNFNTGSAVAILMLLPSVISIGVLRYLSRYNIRYTKISTVELPKNKGRDFFFGGISFAFLFVMLSVFAVIFVVPFVEQWPFKLVPTTTHITAFFADKSLMNVFTNSLFVSALSAVLGTLLVYGSALISARNELNKNYGKIIDGFALITNAIPGMVLGVAYLMAFKGTPLQNTFGILILCNVVHFFSSPYLMMKNGLEKLNASWETTAKLMGDSWFKTVVRIITPNAMDTILQVFIYFFINSMVTVSAVIFIAGARTMVITAKIKELQHFANFNEIFVLSILILGTNLLVKGAFALYKKYKNNRRDKNYETI